MSRLCLLALLIFTIAATTPAPDPSPELEIENQSQYMILELRIHTNDSYEDAENILDAPLAVGETIAPSTKSGSRFLTFFRERSEQGRVLAFTTSRAIELHDGGLYRVTIFDESFRVEVLRDIEPPGGCSCASITGGK